MENIIEMFLKAAARKLLKEAMKPLLPTQHCQFINIIGKRDDFENAMKLVYGV